MSVSPQSHRSGGMRRRLVGTVVFALATASTAALGLSGSAQAAITAPTDGTVVRDAGPITITEDRGGQYANIAAATTSNSILARGCNGADPARQKANGTIKVIRVSDGTVVASQFHETANNLFSLSTANATGPYTATWDTTGATPGLYRIVSTVNDRAKVTSTTCTPDTNTVLSDITVEFRPWQHNNFNDLLGHGKVRMNSNPREVQFTVDGTTSSVIAATPAEMVFYASPAGMAALPSDPSTCATSPASCLPASASACEPSAGCTPRLVTINRQGATEKLNGVFDLETGAFAANATINGKYRLLVSAGTDLDATVSDLIAQAAANGSAATGVNLLALLNTSVKINTLVSDGTMTTIDVGVLKGLQIAKVLSGGSKGGISIDAPYTINAGFTTHTVGTHYWSAAEADPSVNVVTKSPLVPNVPTLFSTSLGSLGSIDIVAPVPVPAPANAITGPMLLIGGGPLVNIRSTYPNGTGKHTAGATTTGPSLDTAAGAPSGLPAWVPGFDSATLADNGPMDFVGHAAAFIELPTINLLGTNLDLGSILIGQGVTVYGDSPLPALGTLPLLWDTENPVAAQLNEITSGLALNLLTNPAVGQVLTATLSLLGGGTPDLESVTATLSDLGSFVDLINAVAGTAGLGAVPGLEDAVNEVGVITAAVPSTTPGSPTTPTTPTWNLGPILGPLLGL